MQKVLAQAGIGSRRACEDLIVAGRVSVDGRVVDVLGSRVDPTRSTIEVDGERIITDTKLVHIALNKPAGVVSTMSDPEGRPSLQDYVARYDVRLFHVGRLDADTEGLLLLTNDGPLANALMHPSHEVPKTYLAEVAGPIPRDVGRRLKAGVELEDGVVAVEDFKVVSRVGNRVMVEVVLHEGRKHVVRRLLDAAGHPVQRLVRTRVGPVVLGDLRSGRTRVLSRSEVSALYAAAGL
ncbi:MAG: pseudouridine synthase [Candidatus Nanopelagicales bacterium]